MKLTLVRHATLLIETGEARILVGPMLRGAGSTPPIEDTPNQVRNPLVALPFPATKVGWVFDGIYVAGDTIWCDDVLDAIEREQPRVVVVNASGARFNEGGHIVMDADDVRRVRSVTDAAVVTVHLEAINHCIEPRDAYRAIDGVLVPADGETLTL